MEITSAFGGIGAVSRSMRVRVSSLVVAFALVAATLLVVQQRADAAPASPSAAASIVVPTLDGVSAQIIDFAAIVCPILLAIRAAFHHTVFFGFIDAILNQLLVAFGCAPSG